VDYGAIIASGIRAREHFTKTKGPIISHICMLIYKIESLIDGRVFVGQTTTSLDKRVKVYAHDMRTFIRGKYKHRSKIIAALAKYGFENFRFFPIDYASSQEELDAKERLWISIYNSTIQGIGFNIQLGGFGVGKHSDETKKIMSDKKKGKPAHNKGKPGLSGENVGNAALTQEQANQIREEYKTVKSSIKLAQKYGVSKPTILSIIKNKRYRNGNEEVILPPKPWFVYIIQSSKDNTLYTGITLDVDARLKTHNEGRGARYTRGRGPFVLRKTFQVSTKSDALKLEYKIKQLSKEEKLNFTDDP
jgi:putative endonuclease